MSGNVSDQARALVATALGKSIDEVPSDGAIATVPGWDSLGHVRLMMSLEQRLGRTLMPEEIVRLQSVAAIASMLS
jgi:acyl carrier protein